MSATFLCPKCKKRSGFQMDAVHCEHCGWKPGEVCEVGKAKRKQKYNAKKCYLDGHTFDSIRERDRYLELKQQQSRGEISQLEVHVQYDLGVCKMEPDFRYRDSDGNIVVEDVKSKPTRTKVYMLKKKLLKQQHGIDISEVF